MRALRISAKPPLVLPHGVSMEPDLIELAASDSAGEHVFGESQVFEFQRDNSGAQHVDHALGHGIHPHYA